MSPQGSKNRVVTAGSSSLTETIPTREQSHEPEVASSSDDTILCRLSNFFSNPYTKRDDDVPHQICHAALSVLYDKAVVLSLPTPPCVNRKNSGSVGVSHMLSFLDIEELETLDPTDPSMCPTAGQCQFACVASSLSKKEFSRLRFPHRPDLDLRRLALHTISHNPHMYQDFLTTAGGRRTRSQSTTGGRGVDMKSYLSSMSDPKCDGDAITLQALCDALKITIRVVKPVKQQGRNNDVYINVYSGNDDEIYRRHLLRLLHERMQFEVTESIASLSDECDSEDDCPSMESTECSISSTSCPFESCSVDNVLLNENPTNPKSYLSVSEEIRPRRLSRIDSRVKEVQSHVRRRLIWLSHVGPGEAHFRYLRTSAIDNKSDTKRMNEKILVQRSLAARVSQLRQDNFCGLNDGYVQHIVLETNIGIGSKRYRKEDATDPLLSSVVKKCKLTGAMKVPTRRRLG
eukprot:CAMPEP_0171322120 /NCGR_PEP_ID=MMETSP0816-20121228/114760_1 /TAXON_ID=420281 /ORGANISM="Proboscia inermis, Strain CCAP1064/1" /LENGTH=459 /DNA_ID=CAMNT_0011820517 /DNA_START=584 /DNA_END=1962 /DNA_ORIENTATION=-